ncbi:cytochrome c oxidase assembly protein [Janibacter sp. G1551]|uniref:cytochrome c oxidase assembly protein n=1 Tax=Janibacter sp. G1551 TaxID=3420440 RepID=UPI003D0846DC
MSSVPATTSTTTGPTTPQGGGRGPLPLVILVGVGLVAAVVGVLVGGAAQSYPIGDPGALVRWGLPLLRLIHDLSASATIGLLLVGAFLVPETVRTNHRVTLARSAAVAAVVWAAAALVGTVLSFADTAGITLGSPGFVDQYLAFVLELETTRGGLITAGLAIVVAIGASIARTKGALAWLLAFAVLALWPVALNGHSSASRDHMGGVNAIFVHLIGACVWVGGLLALALVRGMLGRHLAATVRRYSVVAGWAYGAIVLSGILALWINLTSWGDFLSAYGAIVGVKVVTLVLLGLLGWQQRRSVVARLESLDREAGPAADGTSAKGATATFVRLLAVELVLMGIAFGAAAALSRTPAPAEELLAPPTDAVYELTQYPAPPEPTTASWWNEWLIDWLWVAVAAVAVGVYLAWVLRLRRRGDAWPVLRTISWVLGWVVFVYFTSGAPGVYGKVSFSWHMVMHMGVAMIVPLLLVPGAPITLALRALPVRKDKTLGPRELLLALVHSRYLQVLANPIIAAAIFFFSLAIFYWSPLFELALRTHTGHVLMMIHFVASGYLFAWVLVGIDPGPKRAHPLFKLVVLFVTVSFHAFFGVVMTDSSTLLAAPFFDALDLSWIPDPLADQHRGGAIAWGVGEAPTLVLALMVATQWVRSDRAEQIRRDRQADRDGDAELAAYNADLARRADRG